MLGSNKLFDTASLYSIFVNRTYKGEIRHALPAACTRTLVSSLFGGIRIRLARVYLSRVSATIVTISPYFTACQSCTPVVRLFARGFRPSISRSPVKPRFHCNFPFPKYLHRVRALRDHAVVLSFLTG